MISSSRVYIGIDPGEHGGLAALLPTGHIQFRPMPEKEVDICKWINQFSMNSDCPHCAEHCNLASHPIYNAVACIEKVGGFIARKTKNGKQRPQQGHSMFNFGQGYGFLRGCLISNGFELGKSLYEIPPQRWQRGLDIDPRDKEETDSQWKNRLKDKCSLFFPQLMTTLSTSDALLLAYYCRLTYN